MPTKRTRIARSRNSPLAEKRLLFLKTGELSDKFSTLYGMGRPSLKSLWRRHGAKIVADHIRRQPCTRPDGWWMFDAPDEYRLVVGGSGSGEHGPTPPDQQYWDHIQPFERIGQAGVQVESETAFLARHELLTPSELKHLYSHPGLMKPVLILPFDPGFPYDWRTGTDRDCSDEMP